MNNINREIDDIITEEIERMLITEGIMGDIKNILSSFFKDTRNLFKDTRKSKEKHPKKRTRRKKFGGKETYNYDEYEKDNRKISKSDADGIRNEVDPENTDIAAVSRKVFPKHTKEGGQSQLRKILNGERPMTKNVAKKLSKMISKGQIAVK